MIELSVFVFGLVYRNSTDERGCNCMESATVYFVSDAVRQPQITRPSTLCNKIQDISQGREDKESRDFSTGSKTSMDQINPSQRDAQQA